MVTQPGIPNSYSISTTCYGTRLRTVGDQAFAAVAMGFRRLELGVSEQPVPLNGFEDSARETGVEVGSIVAGCMDPRCEHPTATRLGSPDEDTRERALNSLRRHVRLAQRCACETLIVRGCEVEDRELEREASELEARRLREGPSEELSADAQAFVGRVQKKAQRQLEHLCRSMHTVLTEFPGVRLAIEPGPSFLDLLSFEMAGWCLDDLARHKVGFWHDTASFHQRQRLGLEPLGAWLDTYASRTLGAHLADSAELDVGLPPGAGEVDFRLVQGYLPRAAERVLEVKPTHGRGEILAAVQYLSDLGF